MSDAVTNTSASATARGTDSATSTALHSLIRTRGGSPTARNAFVALLWRDIFVTGKEFVIFLAQVILQPLFLLFIFGKVLGDLGYTQGNYAHVLFPGIVALTVFLTGLQNTALPLVLDFSFSREIEDRLLAPLPTNLVAIEKLVHSCLRGVFAGAMMFPIGYWMLGPLPLTWSDAPVTVVYLLLGALAGSAIGLTLGTFVPPERINMMFALIMTPLIFTGSVQFPWPQLERIAWFQAVTTINPLTYLSELMRAQMVPSLPHIPQPVAALLLCVVLALFISLGVYGFRRRALD